MASQEAGAGVVAGVRRPPLDAWSVREQLCLASAVTRAGDQSWVSVARALRPLAATTDRPSDWFGQRSCAAQYGALLEKCRTPRRKKRLSDGNSPSPAPVTESPQEAILNRLTDDRIAELQTLMTEDAKQYAALKAEIKELTSGTINEARIRAMAAAMEAELHNKEVEATKHTQWLREREERKAILERTWRRSDSDTPHPSPLLTSLLQSSAPVHQTANLVAESLNLPVVSTVVTTKPVESITTNVSDSMSVQMGNNKVAYHELQKIEQIKSELQKIEQNLIEGSMPAESILPSLHNVPQSDLSSKDQVNVETLKTPEKIDIDDIEIKAEDVYAFSDIDLDIPPVSSIHKTPMGRAQSDKNLFNKRELSNNADLEDLNSSEHENMQEINITVQPQTLSEINETIVGSMSATIEITDHSKDNTENANNNMDPNGEIKIESIAPETDVSESSSAPVETEVKEEKTEVNIEEDKTSEAIVNVQNNENQDIEAQKLDKDVSTENSTESQSMDKDAENKTDSNKPGNELLESNIETDDDTPIEVIKEDKPGKTKRDYSRKKTEKDERSSPPRELEGMIGNKMEFSDEVGSDNSQESADKKILSRRFRADRGSRSESPATPTDSLPNSPASNTPPCTSASNASSTSAEQDKDYKIWKKSVIQTLNRLHALKYASLFMKPITDDQAPGYSQAVKRPMDLTTIRRNIDLGVTRTTQEFHRDVLLMLTNALMYNRTDHRVYTMARETIQDAMAQISLLLQAQAHAAAENTNVSRLTRPPRPASRLAGAAIKRKRGNTSGGSDTPTNTKKRRADDS